MRVVLLSAAAVLALAACSSPKDAAAPAPAEPRALAGVDLDQPVRVLGTEPFWAVEITPQALTYSGVDRPEQTAANPGPVLQGGLASWTTKTAAGAPLVVTLTATDCSDGMSDRTYRDHDGGRERPRRIRRPRLPAGAGPSEAGAGLAAGRFYGRRRLRSVHDGQDGLMTPFATPIDLRPLTSLRFFAALWVVVYLLWPNLAVGGMPNLAAKGYLGVELFFVLSGFILSHVYLQGFGEKRFGYGRFIWARIARIYPLHLFTLAGVMALGLAATAAGMAIDASVLSWKTLLPNLLLVHAWGIGGEAGWNHPSWSISAEWFAYLTFPVFAAAAWSLRRRPWLATAGAALLLVGLYVGFERVAGYRLTEATFKWGALRIVPCFAYGCALYLVYRRGVLPRAGLLALLAAAVMAAGAALGSWDGVIVLAGGLLILALASVPAGRTGVMGSAPAVYLGEISYAIYMLCAPWQILAVNVAARLTGAEDKKLPLLLWLAILAGLIVAAAIVHRLVERPARTALRRWGDKRRSPVDGGRKQSETVLQPSDTIV
jgi:peptidoglycan/LPS O-acetylase OafA/YrhL/uncharacterized membrane protein